MNLIKRVEHTSHYSWIINTNLRWCNFVIQKYFYDDGVVLEEYNEDGECIERYLLDLFPVKSLPYFNQEKDQIFIVTIKGE